MTKKEIVNDMNFKQQCRKYGLDGENCVIYDEYDEVILLPTPIEDLYILFDKNYNTIAIDKLRSDYLKEDRCDFVERKNDAYCNFTDIVPYGENFGYPFEDFTLKQVIDLSSRIEIRETDQGHVLSTKINGEWYHRPSREHEDYFQLLSYIKFLGEEVKHYFLTTYHLQALGLEVPNVYEYVRSLINQVNDSICFHTKYNKRPEPASVLSCIGQNDRAFSFNGMLNDVIDLLMNDKDKTKRDSSNAIESMDKSNLSVLAMKTLKILDLSYDDLKIKEEEVAQNAIERPLSEVMPWVGDIIEDEMPSKKAHSLVKNKKC